jgi:insulysin
MFTSVGSMYDPENAQGLAHFLEHMLFMGTRDYPEENEYSAFLNSHGGFSNAYTAQENTVYYFDVQADSLEVALSMFASFFTCPLFAEGSVSREIKAVDSENQKNLQSDTWRHYQLFKSLAKPGHPFSRFSTGNLKTLGETPAADGLNIRDLMLKFYEDYYSANLMKLVVYGKESLDVLQGWVEEKFALVVDKELVPRTFDANPYEGNLGRYLEVVPIKDSKSLEIEFLMPAYWQHYRSKPER